MEWLSKFKIARYADGVGALRPLNDLILAEPSNYRYQSYARVAGQNGRGEDVQMGFPFALMEWDWLPQTDIDILQGYQAQDLYVRAEVDTGASAREYKIFLCYAQPLDLGDTDRRVGHDGNDGFRQRRPVTWRWSHMIEQ